MLFRSNRCFPYRYITKQRDRSGHNAANSHSKAIGEPTPVANKMAPAASAQTVTPIKTLSTTLTYLATRKYFSLNASRLLISSSKNFCTLDITFNLCDGLDRFAFR